jgi:hypothetical protein
VIEMSAPSIVALTLSCGLARCAAHVATTPAAHTIVTVVAILAARTPHPLHV